MIFFLLFLYGNAVRMDRLNAPIVGIVSLPTDKKNQTYASTAYSMIPGSYVKWLEQSGVRVIPIRYDLPTEYLDKLLNIVNGVLFTGGSAELFQESSKLCQYKKMLNEETVCPSQYMIKLKYILNKVQEMNKEGNVMPLWATCLGFEALIIAESDFTLKRISVKSENHSLSIAFNVLQQSFIDEILSKEQQVIAQNKPVFYFNHKYAFTKEQVENNKFTKDTLDVIATAKLEDNTEVVSFVKHKKYPIFGAQFHPEKIQFEHKNHLNIFTDYDSIEIAHKFSMFFYTKVLQNKNYIDDDSELEALLIYNYPLQKSGGVFEQFYVFPKFFDFSPKNQ